MTEMKLRRGKASPKKEAADFTATGKDKDGFDVKYISSDKGRGVFSCVHFNKGDFLVEYRGQLINKLECDHRQKVYHDALKVFMFEFRFNGKLLWSINPGEEITYNYGDSEWPWRSKTASEKHQLQPQEMSTTSSEAVSEADPFTPTTAVTLEAIKQREQNEAGTVPEVTTSPTVVKDKSETVVPIEDTEKNEAGTVPEVTTSPTVVKDKSETVVPIEDTEKIAVVKEQSGSEGQETIGPSEKTAKNNELDQVADFLGHDIRVHREYYRLPEATIQLAKISKLLLAMEKGRLPDLQGKSLDDIEIEDEINTDGSAGSESENGGEGENLEACTSTPLQIGMRKDQTPNEDEAGAVVQGNVAADAGNSRKRTRTPWSKREEVAVMKYFKSHIAKGKLATMVECLQCKTAEDPVLAGRTAQNIRDFVRNRGITLKRKAQCD
ncbi:hypothetical protein QTP70_017325 [Hemibagrus guttatus]|uniref:SET domain-containing protein n=1 Tax=Hemibagrus guttatus TaxID=175788 RepID=A0AAE0UJA4_9TELE|nr:hypothetical protein QTP70_017325 [Hemibagrus guttatus]